MRESERARNDRGSAKSQRPLAHGSKASAPAGDDRAVKGVPGVLRPLLQSSGFSAILERKLGQQHERPRSPDQNRR